MRLKITENTYETVITNLSRNEFSMEDICEIYNMRWGEETSFRELKYAIGLNALHWYYVKKKCQLNRNFFYLTSTFEKC